MMKNNRYNLCGSLQCRWGASQRCSFIVGIAMCIVLLLGAFSSSFGASVPGKTTLSVQSKTYTSVSLKWKQTSGAVGYKLYRASSKSGKYKLITTVQGKTRTAYRDSGLRPNTGYYYKLRAYSKSGSRVMLGKMSSCVNLKTSKIKGSDRIVYVTDSGTKYHYSKSCAGGSCKAATLEGAAEKGYSPCSKCVYEFSIWEFIKSILRITVTITI